LILIEPSSVAAATAVFGAALGQAIRSTKATRYAVSVPAPNDSASGQLTVPTEVGIENGRTSICANFSPIRVIHA
jgi:hypothetical protein